MKNGVKELDFRSLLNNQIFNYEKLKDLKKPTKSDFTSYAVSHAEIEKLNQCKREQNQQKYDTREQNENGENTPNIRLKGNVAKTKRRHYRERPIKPSYPRMLLSFPGHQRVEHDGEHDHHPR